MKKAVAILLLPMLLLQHFMSIGMWCYYEANKSYYIQQLCENKNKPALHCNGKCYLAKQMKKAEEGNRKAFSFLKGVEDALPLQPLAVQKQHHISQKHPFLPYLFGSATADPLDLLKPPCKA
ncbi:MAG: hypothetical protein U0T73_12945 [Chitinophagales bacterium]